MRAFDQQGRKNNYMCQNCVLILIQTNFVKYAFRLIRFESRTRIIVRLLHKEKKRQKKSYYTMTKSIRNIVVMIFRISYTNMPKHAVLINHYFSSTSYLSQKFFLSTKAKICQGRSKKSLTSVHIIAKKNNVYLLSQHWKNYYKFKRFRMN